MAHQDYSQICPIFKEGVEHDIFFDINLSHTVTAVPTFIWQPGREITIFEAYANTWMSTGKSVSASFSIKLYKNNSLSITSGACFGSVAHGKTEMDAAIYPNTGIYGMCETTGSITSTSFTSTDLLFAAQILEVGGGSGCMNPTIHIRYRDK